MDYTNLNEVVGVNLDLDHINKEAQWTRMKRWMGERVSGSYKEKMDILRKQDDAIRVWAKDLNKIVSLMNKYLKQSKMVELGYLLDTLNRRLIQIGIFGKEVQDISEQAKHQFDVQHDLKSLQRQFGKEAGIFVTPRFDLSAGAAIVLYTYAHQVYDETFIINSTSETTRHDVNIENYQLPVMCFNFGLNYQLTPIYRIELFSNVVFRTLEKNETIYYRSLSIGLSRSLRIKGRGYREPLLSW